ncbi:hypothetical protein BC830DRAFT_1065663 [Chytriomyces sp. MP71]|nr:hypothetical protein BC830DRAFT_1065663 [Chytriomyces sp. MP71]
MEAARQRREEKDLIHNKVLVEGAKMGTALTLGAVAASLAANRFIPVYRSLRFPFKLSLVIAASTAGFFTATDRATMYADREFSQKFSVTREEEVSAFSHAAGDEASGMRGWDGARWKEFAFKNRYSLLGYGYLGIVGSTLAYNFTRRDIFMTQKFVNARIIGQFSGIAGILLIGAVSATGEHRANSQVQADPYYDRIVNNK